MSECIFGDWTFDIFGAPWFAFRAGERFPLRWDGPVVREVNLTEGLIETIPYVALAAHWAKAHPELLEVMVGGPVEIDGFPRLKHL